MAKPCSHVALIGALPAPRDVCETCVTIGSSWKHLRQCLICGRTLCCDSSPNRHMAGHYREVGHPLMRPADEPDDWIWCFADELTMRPANGGWEGFDPFFDDGLWFAQRHVDAGERLPDAEDYVTPEGFPLGRWVTYAREREADGELDENELDGLRRLRGWQMQIA